MNERQPGRGDTPRGQAMFMVLEEKEVSVT